MIRTLNVNLTWAACESLRELLFRTMDSHQDTRRWKLGRLVWLKLVDRRFKVSQ